MTDRAGGKPVAVDVSEFKDAERRNGSACWWHTLDFSPEQRKKLEYVLIQRPDITSAAIARVMKQWEFEVNEQAVRNHRNSAHRCKKPNP